MSYIFKIPGEWLTLRGIEYFIEAYDRDGNYSYYPMKASEFNYISPPVRIPEPGVVAEDYNGNLIPLHTGGSQSDYRLISIPENIDQDKRSVLDILKSSLGFSKYDENYWRCVDYHHFPVQDTSYFIYLNDSRFSDFSPGKSFFFILNKGLINKTILCPSGYTIRTDNIYKMVLNKGWNLIANPFNFPIPFKNLYLSESGNVDSIRSFINGWDWENDFIYPWTGYALYTEEADSIFINPDLRQSFRSLSIKKENTPEYEWSISIEASCQEACNSDNLIAVSPNASFEYDNFDQPEPPPIGEYIMLSFPHPEWEKACDFFTVDVQPPNLEGNFWDFSVYTNMPNSNVKLNFQNLNAVPDNIQIILISEILNYIQDLRNNGQFSYNSITAQQEYRFRLLVGSQEFVESHNFNIDFLPERFNVSTNFPNPFNNATYIRYDLPGQDEISIQIYNMLGELIKTIKKNEIHSSGKYFVIWDGTNEKGHPVGSGIYFCKFISQHCFKTIKMLLIR